MLQNFKVVVCGCHHNVIAPLYLQVNTGGGVCETLKGKIK